MSLIKRFWEDNIENLDDEWFKENDIPDEERDWLRKHFMYAYKAESLA